MLNKPPPPPNYKDHLRSLIHNHNRNNCSSDGDDDDIIEDYASLEASILSGNEEEEAESQESNRDGHDQSDFLSVTPSMLNSSIFNTSDMVDQDSQMEGMILTGDQQDHNSATTATMHDRSVYENIGASLMMQQKREEKVAGNLLEDKGSSKACATSESVKNQDGCKKDPMVGELLQIGTIVAGVAGIALCLAFGSKDSTKDEAKQSNNRCTSEGRRKQSKNRLGDSPHRGWLLKSW